MTGTINKNNDDINIAQLTRELLRKAPFIVLLGLMVAVCVWVILHQIVTEKYQATATMYVNNRTPSVTGLTSISTADLNASALLVDTCEAIILNEAILECAIEESGVEITVSEIQEHITVSSVNSTQVFTITVEDSVPENASAIANAIAAILPDKMLDIVEGCSVNLISMAKVPDTIYSPHYIRDTVVGTILGMLLGCVLITIRELSDTVVRKEDDFKNWEYPLLASIPDYYSAEEGFKYGYGTKKKNENI